MGSICWFRSLLRRYCIVPGKERLAMLLAAILSRVGKKMLGEGMAVKDGQVMVNQWLSGV